jgi:hypothetical protein
MFECPSHRLVAARRAMYSLVQWNDVISILGSFSIWVSFF